MIQPIHLPQFTHRFVPAEAPADALLLGLHGRGDSLEGFDWLPEALDLPGLNYLFMNAPDDYGPGFSWYDLPPNQGPGVLRSRQLLTTAIDTLGAQGWSPARIVLCGFSQGCLMALDVGLRYPQPLAGICGISGYLFFPDRVRAEMTSHAPRMPWLMTHGTRDAIVPIAPTRAHVKLLQTAGIPVEWHEFRKAHGIDPQRELPVIRAWLAKTLSLDVPG